ncbi:guanine nucleotide binding protein alpha subunit [Gloeophyllum trabeum ATCC 11539]|uniref:Guanine nucleotide binding protein alpha subunit n=1 Tax=Gloeophyllum trabeum (strain ATCC 11539 / FP-39264 / Madison 617) TaxID=670483 RepID=S7Q2C5_GLOTA|nr:guanine nucleotide binding protein alpha subunit [Gloeophyllum trabeum ATCC 11539]EPQ53703.1 guanine nucleotide binding protein alpha subunit [Gloeophyllum trabeum ATCC 11539]
MPSIRVGNSDDPFEHIMRPPPDETPEQKAERLRREEEAKRISQQIDESIKMERIERKKKRVVRLLLLGQSESGKSTTLRQFQRLYTPTAFRQERVLWRSVIQLNLIRSIRTILDALPSSSALGSPALPEIRERLEVLRDVEHSLIRMLTMNIYGCILAAKAVDCPTTNGNWPWSDQEVYIRPGTAWKGALAKLVQSMGDADGDIPPSPTSVLYRLREDIMALWTDRGVREVLRRRKLRLEEGPGLLTLYACVRSFLNDIERVTSLKYTPTEDDVLKARLKTVGVSEYKFEMEASAGKESGTEWRIVDVGGSRSQVTTWMPFFDDVDAIIFLAPISGFDQVLTEDRSVNRLEDSVLLWKAICSNKLLANVELVLFLNKCDILDQKLKSGVRLAKYVRSFGDRPNDLETASKYFRSKFNAIQREYSPNPRKFYGFCTSVTDTTTTAGILASVRDMVIRQHLKQSKLL